MLNSRRSFLKLMTALGLAPFLPIFKSRVAQAMGDDTLYVRRGQRVYLSEKYYRRVVVLDGGEVIGAVPGCTLGDLELHVGAKAGFASVTASTVTMGASAMNAAELKRIPLDCSISARYFE